MAKKIYAGANNVAQRVKSVYVGVNNIARKVVKGYVGVNGVAQQFYSLFTPVNYLQSSGTQNISTNVYPYKTKVEIKFQLPSIPTTPAWYYFSGCYNDNNNRFYVGSTSTSNNFMAQDRYGSQITLKSGLDTNVHTLIYNDANNKVYFDGTSKGTVSDLTTQVSNTYDLFSRGWVTQAPPALRIYYVKVTDKTTNTLIRDMIPVLDNSNVACMYDKVTKEFFYNNGTGTFTYG